MTGSQRLAVYAIALAAVLAGFTWAAVGLSDSYLHRLSETPVSVGRGMAAANAYVITDSGVKVMPVGSIYQMRTFISRHAILLYVRPGTASFTTQLPLLGESAPEISQTEPEPSAASLVLEGKTIARGRVVQDYNVIDSEMGRVPGDTGFLCSTNDYFRLFTLLSGSPSPLSGNATALLYLAVLLLSVGMALLVTRIAGSPGVLTIPLGLSVAGAIPLAVAYALYLHVPGLISWAIGVVLAVALAFAGLSTLGLVIVRRRRGRRTSAST